MGESKQEGKDGAARGLYVAREEKGDYFLAIPYPSDLERYVLSGELYKASASDCRQRLYALRRSGSQSEEHYMQQSELFKLVARPEI